MKIASLLKATDSYNRDLFPNSRRAVPSTTVNNKILDNSYLNHRDYYNPAETFSYQFLRQLLLLLKPGQRRCLKNKQLRDIYSLTEI